MLFTSRFVDNLVIRLIAGSGGDGCVAFAPSRSHFLGPPSGGNGGCGASIMLYATRRVTCLGHLRSKYKAPDGQNGKGSSRHGQTAKAMEISVPLGTRVTVQQHLIEQKEKYRLYANWEDRGEIQDYEKHHKSPKSERKESTQELDLKNEGDFGIVVQGGSGGLGNICFQSNTNKHPKFCARGQPGQSATATLQLRLLADVGLIGLPNAGKSSLLRVLTRARPRVAEYAFSTLQPVLGVMDGCVLADIPGLISGASQGRGLGAASLQHVERSRALAFVIDLSVHLLTYSRMNQKWHCKLSSMKSNNISVESRPRRCW